LAAKFRTSNTALLVASADDELTEEGSGSHNYEDLFHRGGEYEKRTSGFGYSCLQQRRFVN